MEEQTGVFENKLAGLLDLAKKSNVIYVLIDDKYKIDIDL